MKLKIKEPTTDQKVLFVALQQVLEPLYPSIKKCYEEDVNGSLEEGDLKLSDYLDMAWCCIYGIDYDN